MKKGLQFEAAASRGEIPAAKRMESLKRVSDWSVEDVLEWVEQQFPGQQSTLRTAFLQHAVSGRALLRMRGHHLHHLGVEAPAQQGILQDILLLRVQEELDNLNDIFSECFAS